MSTNTKKPTSTNRDDNTYDTNSSAPTLQQAYEETASKFANILVPTHLHPKTYVFTFQEVLQPSIMERLPLGTKVIALT